MILYELTCPNSHGFEGWFSSSSDFDRQSVAGHIACPVCSDPGVTRAPMAPRIAKHSHAPQSEHATPMETPRVEAPSEASKMISDFCEQVASSHDYVGSEFPEEARKIHYGETKKRAIYGEATIKDAVKLKDEGIDVIPIPWVKKGDA